MAKDNILDAIQPPDGWRETRSQAAIALLTGAAASLFMCRKFLSHYDPSMPLKYDPAQIANDFPMSVDENDTVHWDKTHHLLVWSIGFFLNKAQQNIAAALDTCTNAWVALKLGVDQNQLMSGDVQGLFYPHVTTRFLIVAPNTDENTQRMLDDLRKSFEDHGGTEEAKNYIKKISKKFGLDSTWPSLDYLYQKLEETQIEWKKITKAVTKSDCTAAVFGRVNAFKHQVTGYRHDRDGIDHLVEWAVTAKALTYIKNLWEVMIKDLQITQKE